MYFIIVRGQAEDSYCLYDWRQKKEDAEKIYKRVMAQYPEAFITDELKTMEPVPCER